MNKNQGFILLPLLIFMQIYILLGLTALRNALLSEKIHAQEQARRALANQGKIILNDIAAALRNHTVSASACMVAPLPASQIRQKSFEWWASFACQGSSESYRYDYIVENLGQDKCSWVMGDPESVAYYYRVTVRMRSAMPDMLLQETMAMAQEAPITEQCSGERYMVRGRWGNVVEI